MSSTSNYWVWPFPEPLFMSSTYCVHDLFHAAPSTDVSNMIFLGTDDKSPDFINYMDITDAHMARANQERIQNVAEGLNNRYFPYVDEICLAEIDGEWYRSEFLGIIGDLARVYCVDFGVICFCDATRFRVS